MPEEETEETGGYREPGAFPKAQKAPDGIDCPQWCGAGLLHQLESPQGIQKFPESVATFFHTRKNIPGIPKVLQGSGQLNPGVCPPGKLHQWDQNTQALNMSLGLFHRLILLPIHRLYICPAGLLRIRAREAH